MRISRGLAPLAAGFALLHMAAAAAQQAGLHVTVIDQHLPQSGEAPGYEVRVDNAAIGLHMRQRLAGGRQARFEPLPTTGRYRVSAWALDEAGGSVALDDLQLRSGEVRAVQLLLRPAPLEEVQVSARRAGALANRLNAEVAASLDSTALAALPIAGRDALTSLVRMPNVAWSTGFFPEAPPVSINGANGLYINYLLDSIDNNENFLGGQKFPVPLGVVQQATVLANNFSSEFGRSANGIVNFTTRGGTNERQREVYGQFRPGRPIDSPSRFRQRDLSGNAVSDDFSREQYGVTVSGPMRKDWTHYLLNLEYTDESNAYLLDSPILGLLRSIPGRNRYALGSLRLDQRVSALWAATLRAHLGRIALERPGGGLGGGNVTFPSAGSAQDRDSSLLALTMGRRGSRYDYELVAQFSRFDWNYARPSQAGPQFVLRDESGLPIAVLGNPGFVFDSREKSAQFGHKLSWQSGNHRLKLGAEFLQHEFSLAGGGNPNGNFTLDLTADEVALLGNTSGTSLPTIAEIVAFDPLVANYAVELRPARFGVPQRLWAAYAEDEWHPDERWTVTAGVRWDKDSLSGAGSGREDKDNFAPRLAVNFRPDQLNVMRAGIGIFYDKLTYAVISDALQRNSDSVGLRSQLQQLIALGALPADTTIDRVLFPGNLTVNPACLRITECPSGSEVALLREQFASNEIRIKNPSGYENPYSVQIMLGWQRELANELLFSVDALFNRSLHLVRLRDLNAPAPFAANLAALTPQIVAQLQSLPDNAARLTLAHELGLVRTPAEADASRPVAIVPGGARQITVSETAGTSTYRALTLRLTRPLQPGAVGIDLAYTLSKLENDTDDINFRAADANDFTADYGPSANDRRHALSLVGTISPRAGWEVTVAALLQSGQPINFVPDGRIFGTQDLNGDGMSFGENYLGNSDRYPGTGRNSGRLPWSSNIDVGLRYNRALGKGSARLSVDIFNLLDSNNWSGFANAATTSNQIQFGGGVQPVQRNAGARRQFQIALDYSF
ncbi:MAG: TonB-dependent receptor [Steroidobacteraceae bacterium]